LQRSQKSNLDRSEVQPSLRDSIPSRSLAFFQGDRFQFASVEIL